MKTLIAYTKHITTLHTVELRLPAPSVAGEGSATELCTLPDGRTIVLLDGITLPSGQPAEIASSIETVQLDAPLLALINEHSPHVRLINTRVQERIRERYSLDAELKILRTRDHDALTAYNAHVEAAVAWGREQKAALGLVLPLSEEAAAAKQRASRFAKRAAVKDHLLATMAAENTARVQAGTWTVADLTGLLTALAPVLTMVQSLSYELAAQHLQTATHPKLTAEIKAGWVAQLQAHFYPEG